MHITLITLFVSFHASNHLVFARFLLLKASASRTRPPAAIHCRGFVSRIQCFCIPRAVCVWVYRLSPARESIGNYLLFVSNVCGPWPLADKMIKWCRALVCVCVCLDTDEKIRQSHLSACIINLYFALSIFINRKFAHCLFVLPFLFFPLDKNVDSHVVSARSFLFYLLFFFRSRADALSVNYILISIDNGALGTQSQIKMEGKRTKREKKKNNNDLYELILIVLPVRFRVHKWNRHSTTTDCGNDFL